MLLNERGFFMWDRGILKANAKNALRGRYWNAFLVSLLAFVVTGTFSIVHSIMTWNLRWNEWLFHTNPMEYITQSNISDSVSFLGIFFGIFVGYPIVVGLARYYVHNHFGETDSNLLFTGFSRNYGNGVGTIFVTKLFIDLWTLLFIIPGIYKSLQYSMVKYILSDNPAMPGSRAREISRILTNGEKGAIFILQLSFIGWYLLGLICGVIGILFVNPYCEATMAELYLFLRDRAIHSGMVHPAEFGLVPPDQNTF